MQYQEDPKNWKVPETFEEYLSVYPKYHLKWLTKRYASYTHEDFDDIAQHLLVRTLETKRVEKFDSKKRGGIHTPGMFFDYMAHCFARDLRTFFTARDATKRRVDKLSESLEDYENFHQNGREISTSESLSLSSQAYATRTKQEGDRPYNSARLKQFREFVAKHRGDLIPVLDAMESGDDLGLPRGIWFLRRAALKGLAKHFDRGTAPHKSNWSKSRDYVKRLESRKYYAQHREQIITNRRRREKRKKRVF
jgi:hypothetical protein